MSLATLTFVSIRLNPASATPAAKPAAAAPSASDAAEPVTTPDRSAQAGCACPPRRSALAEAVQHAVGTEPDGNDELRGAVMDFARALMQALHADDRAGEGRGRHGHGHEHGHHDHGGHHGHRHGHGHHRGHADGEYRALRGLGDRIEALAQRFESAAPSRPAPEAATGTGDDASALGTGVVAPLPQPVSVPLPMPVPVTVQVPDGSDDVDGAAQHAEADGGGGESERGAWQAEVYVASLQIEPRRTPYARMQEQLMDAFRHLRDAMGAPTPADEGGLRRDLAAFLKDLAAGFGTPDAASWAETTAPGALLDLAA